MPAVERNLGDWPPADRSRSKIALFTCVIQTPVKKFFAIFLCGDPFRAPRAGLFYRRF